MPNLLFRTTIYIVLIIVLAIIFYFLLKKILKSHLIKINDEEYLYSEKDIIDDFFNGDYSDY